MRRLDNLSFIIILLLVFLDLWIWIQILGINSAGRIGFTFLDVGQGDAILGVLPGGVKFLNDAGGGKEVIRELEKVLDSGDRYIDLALISHPQLDHFGGFNFVLDQYDVGAFVLNGKEVELPEWQTLVQKIHDKKIPILILGAGDRILNGSSSIYLISPDSKQLQSGELNDSSLVEIVKVPETSLFLAGDISERIEKYLIEKSGVEKLTADILKVPHHGSKYSSSQIFIEAVRPKVAVIGVGRNKYGHPTKEALQRLESFGVKIFRTDQDGSVRLEFERGKLKVFSLKN